MINVFKHVTHLTSLQPYYLYFKAKKKKMEAKKAFGPTRSHSWSLVRLQEEVRVLLDLTLNSLDSKKFSASVLQRFQGGRWVGEGPSKAVIHSDSTSTGAGPWEEGGIQDGRLRNFESDRGPWFSARAGLYPQGHLARSGDIFVSHDWEGALMASSEWVEAWDATNMLKCTGQPQEQKIIQPRIPTVLKLRNPDTEK